VKALDADVCRTHMCKGLGFSKEDRTENVRRLAFGAKLLTRVGSPCTLPFHLIARDGDGAYYDGSFLEVYVNAPPSVCECRGLKGLYKNTKAGAVSSFTGIDDPYEAPLAPRSRMLHFFGGTRPKRQQDPDCHREAANCVTDRRNRILNPNWNRP